MLIPVYRDFTNPNLPSGGAGGAGGVSNNTSAAAQAAAAAAAAANAAAGFQQLDPNQNAMYMQQFYPGVSTYFLLPHLLI